MAFLKPAKDHQNRTDNLNHITDGFPMSGVDFDDQYWQGNAWYDYLQVDLGKEYAVTSVFFQVR